MIHIRNVTKRYGTSIAVDDISLEIPTGEICCLIGPSGCGKSTLVKLINRMLEPEGGRILIDGKDTRDFQPELLRRHIGYVIQNVGLFPHMTVAENIAVVPQLLSWNREKIEGRTEGLFRLMRMEPNQYRDKYPRELSGGEAQRIGVARALASDPAILLMDEPFGAVDPLNREALQAEFMKIQSDLKKTVVFVTHDLDEAIRLGDRIALMRAGRIVQYDTPEEILAHPKDRFVSDFVGADRALKRLSRFPVSEFMKEPVVVKVTDDVDAFLAKIREEGKTRFVWLLDEQDRLIGPVDSRHVHRPFNREEDVMEANCPAITVRNSATLREVLSRMLGQGVKTIPVIDDDSRLVGEISIGEIEKVTEEAAFEC
ncbi:MAG TPA: ABC transporter ATP-binding protein [Syntrophales bacterium]|mgnify:CR=1 FL=1|nr:ABC transporter ATP-binding protein [Syntrophales bacterium]